MFAPLILSKNHCIIFAMFFWKDDKLLVDFARLRNTDGIGMMANASCTCVSIKSSSKQLLFILPVTGYWWIQNRYSDQTFGRKSCPVLASLVRNQTPVITAKNPCWQHLLIGSKLESRGTLFRNTQFASYIVSIHSYIPSGFLKGLCLTVSSLRELILDV